MIGSLAVLLVAVGVAPAVAKSTTPVRPAAKAPRPAPAPAPVPTLCEGDYADSVPAARASEILDAVKDQFVFSIRNIATYERVYYGRDGKLRRNYIRSVVHGTGFAYQVKDGETLIVTNEHVANRPDVTDDEHQVDGVPPGSKKVREQIKIVRDEEDDYEPGHVPLKLALSDSAADIAIVKARTVDAWAIAESEYVLEGLLYPRDKRYETAEAERAGVHLVVLPAPEPAWVRGDRYLLERAALNLISNAIEASPPGGQVSIEVSRQDSVASLKVTDAGPGIAPDRLPRIFETNLQGGKHRLLAGLVGDDLVARQPGADIHQGFLDLDTGEIRSAAAAVVARAIQQGALEAARPNPSSGAITLHFTLPRAGRARVSTRMRLADSQNVVAVCQLSDGSLWSDSAAVVVTLAACLEDGI